MAILFNNNFEFTIHDYQVNKDGNLIVVDITIETQRLTLVNVYGPNNDSPAFYEDLSKLVNSYDNVSHIFGGD